MSHNHNVRHMPAPKAAYVRRTIPQQQVAMIIGAFRLGFFVEKAAIA